jgi:carbonic anhydrase
MALFTNETMAELLEKSLETARLTDSGWVDVGSEPGSSAGHGIDWLTFEDARVSVVNDVRRIREHPLVPKQIPIYGYIFNVGTGRLEEVNEAIQIGAAAA